MQRIVIVGATCSGKTTLARELAQRLDYPFVELDALRWEENWQEAPPDIFRERVRQALERESWVIDGNYDPVTPPIWSWADTIIWLDYPLAVNIWRYSKRTLTRLITQEKIYSNNQEILRMHLSRGSLLLWLLKSHPHHRRRYSGLFQDPVYAHLTKIRLRSPRATEQWLNEIDKAGTS